MHKMDHDSPRQASGHTRVVAISSGKGGVGKTSIAVNLGISLAKQGAKVCLFDADIGLANVNILLGLTPEYTLEHVLFGAKDIEDIMLDGPHGMKVVPGANGISECVSLHPRQQLRLTRELARVESEFDFLLIDTAAGISDTTLDFVSAAQHTLIVITGEPTSLTDAFSLIKLLKRRSDSIHYQVVVNMCSSTSQAKEIYHRFSAAVEKYIGVETLYIGYVLRDESLRAAVSLQSPVALFPDTDPSSRSFIRLADALDSATAASGNDHSFSDYWQQQYRQEHDHETSPEQQDQPATDEQKAQERDEDYVSELRSRLLPLVEQGHSDVQQVAGMLNEAVSVYLSRHGTLPVKMISLLEQAILSPERDDQLMRDIYELVKPWGVASASLANDLYMPQSEQSLNVAESIEPVEPLEDIECEAVEYSGDSSSQVEDSSHCAHHYDTQRFGSQQNLLDILMRQGDDEQSLLKLIDKLR